MGAAVGHRLVPRHRVGAGQLDRPGHPARTRRRPGLLRRPTRLPGRGAGVRRGRHGAHRHRTAAPARPAAGRPGAAVDVYIEAASNPDLGSGWEFRPTPLGDPATAGSAPLYRLGAIDVGLLDVPVWELQQDVWTLSGLVAELPADLPRRAEIVRALELMVDAVDPDDVSGTAEAGRAELAAVLASPAYAERAPGARGRARAHRLGLAVAGAGDGAQGGPHVRQRGGAAGGGRATGLRGVLGPAVRVAGRAPPGAVRAGPRPGRGRAVRAGRRDVGGVGHEHARRRGAGPTVRGRQAVLPGAARGGAPGGLAARLVRLLRGAAADHRRGRLPLVPHPEDLLERDERDAAPHVPVGGHRRHPDLHPLPAGGHLQRPAVRRGAGPRRSAGSPRRVGPTPRWSRSGGATAVAGRPGRCWPRRARTRSLEGSPTVRVGAPAEFFAAAEAEYAQRAGVVRGAVPGVPPRHLHHAGPHQAGQPAQRAPAARGRTVGDHGRGARRCRLPGRCAATVLGDGAAAAVPRHPARHLDRLGVPAGRAGVRAGRDGAGRRDRRRAGRADRAG